MNGTGLAVGMHGNHALGCLVTPTSSDSRDRVPAWFSLAAAGWDLETLAGVGNKQDGLPSTLLRNIHVTPQSPVLTCLVYESWEWAGDFFSLSRV